MRIGPTIVATVIALCLAGGAFVLLRADGPARLPRGDAPMITHGKINAPDFPAGLQWLNTDHPVSLKDLRGKVVVLDFWTFCCINCMHVLPDLKRLERKYPKELAVVGVHSAKFAAEQSTDNIREAILRYDIEHPVVNDKDMAVWQSYAVHSWPTLFVIDPDGKVIGYLSGEGVFDQLDALIGAVVKDFDKEGKINRTPIAWRLERTLVAKSPLSFPGKVLAGGPGGRLFIADSNHHRILVATLADVADVTGVAQPPSAGASSGVAGVAHPPSGVAVSSSPQARAPVPHKATEAKVIEVIGSGETGLKDGTFAEARFNKPQGMAVDGNVLYVADTENHAVRKVDLAKRAVTTLAGTGEQARGSSFVGARHAVPVLLNSPWDLVLVGGKLYVAMAGSHQIWVINPETGEAGLFAGSGREARYDAPLAEAALAQPSGIASDGKKLYFADSESSSIREADLDPKGSVTTIVGLDLFEFGDRDGVGDAVRLQHPLGIALKDGLLYVADTYNNKVKVIDPKTRRSDALFGDGKPGLKDGSFAESEFNEPGGLSFAGDKLYVADTNNNALRIADLKTKTVTTLKLTGLPEAK